MKMGILSMVFLITIVWAGAQNKKTEAATLQIYIEQLAKTGWDGGPFLKTYFVDSNGTQIIALLQRSMIKEYITVYKKIPVDSAESVIERNILFKVPYPLSDSSKLSSSLHSFIINNDTLAKYEKLPVHDIVAKYYEKSGRIKEEYIDLRFFLACYFFDKRVLLLNVPQMNQSIDFIRTRRYFGDNIFE